MAHQFQSILQEHPSLAAAASLALVGVCYLLRRDKRPDKAIPWAHFDWPVIGTLPSVVWHNWKGTQMYHFLENVRRYGAFWVEVPSMNGLQLCISDPPSIKVMLEDMEAFRLPDVRLKNWSSREVFGEGIFLSTGEDWMHQRGLARSIFTLPARAEMFETYHRVAQNLLHVLHAAAASGETLELQQLFKSYTLDTFGEIGFGHPINSLLKPIPFSSSFDWIQIELSNLVKYPWRRLTAARQWRYHFGVIEEFIGELIEVRRKEGWEGRKDFLSRLLEMESRKEITGVTEKFLRDQVVNFMIAGRESTGLLMAMACYFLSLNPECEERVAREVEEVVGKEVVTMSHTRELRYLKNVLDETLRLHPTAVPLNARVCLKDVVLPNKARVPKGCHLAYSPFAVHRLKEYWGEDADVFKPERWEEKGVLKHPYQFVPFQKGPRQCLGMNMAYEEVKCCIAILYQNGFRFKIQNNENPVLHNVTPLLILKNGVTAKVIKI